MPTRAAPDRTPLPRAFWMYAAFTAVTMLGFATFGILSFHIVKQGLLSPAWVPVLYAAVMVVDGIAALATGWAYDRFGPRVLLILPLIAAAIPFFAFTNSIAPVIVGSLLWGAALGVQESTLRATVADLVGSHRRSTAYGIFAAIVGVATAAGGILAGGLYETSVPLLIGLTVAAQVVAVIVFVAIPLDHLRNRIDV